VALSATDTALCEKFCVGFIDLSTNNPVAWNWIFPGGSPSFSTEQNPQTICYTQPGTFDVTLITTDANGNNDTLTLTNYITVFTTPDFPTISQNGYTLTSSAANSYQWQLNAADIPGATNQSYDVLQTGFYTVIINDENGCANSAMQYVQITGIDEMADAAFSIYPNPSDGRVMIELQKGQMAGEVSVKVVNPLGQIIYSSKENISSTNWKKEFDLSNLARGIYFIELKSEDGFAKKKIIISK
jgi:PKD repeat protein